MASRSKALQLAPTIPCNARDCRVPCSKCCQTERTKKPTRKPQNTGYSSIHSLSLCYDTSLVGSPSARYSRVCTSVCLTLHFYTHARLNNTLTQDAPKLVWYGSFSLLERPKVLAAHGLIKHHPAWPGNSSEPNSYAYEYSLVLRWRSRRFIACSTYLSQRLQCFRQFLPYYLRDNAFISIVSLRVMLYKPQPKLRRNFTGDA